MDFGVAVVNEIPKPNFNICIPDILLVVTNLKIRLFGFYRIRKTEFS